MVAPCTSAQDVAQQLAGSVFAWGNNSSGQLGNGTTVNSSTPVQVSNLFAAIAIAAGSNSSLALMRDGTVSAWGINTDGQLGNGTAANSTTPVQVSGLTGVLAIAAGSDHALALKNDGSVWAWGYNAYGQLGNGTVNEGLTPVQVSAISGVLAVAAGSNHSLALAHDGNVWAWGFNGFGQLGNGTTTSSSVPVQVSGLSGIVAIAGASNHSLALKNDGTVWAWGYNGFGQLGDGATTSSSLPVQVTDLSGAAAIAGSSHSLALKSDGSIWAWGANGYGQLGTGDTTSSSTPVPVAGLFNATSLAAGGFHSLALKNDGTVWSWGYNGFGQLGNGTTVTSSTPSQLMSLSGMAAIAGGSNHSLGLVGPVATVSLSPGVVDFGSQPIFSTNTVPVTLTNNSTVVLNIRQVFIGGNFTESNDCSTALASGSSCSFTILFSSKTLGAQNGILSVYHDGVGSSLVSLFGTAEDIPLTLTRLDRPARQTLGGSDPAIASSRPSPELGLNANIGIASSISVRPAALAPVAAPTALAVLPSRLVFEPNMMSTTGTVRTVRIVNMQAVPAEISAIEITQDFDFEAHCGVQLAVGESCDIAVIAHPSAIRANNGVLRISTNSGKVTVVLVGNGSTTPAKQ